MYNLWEIRKRKGLSLNALSARTGIPVKVLREYEYGSKSIPYDDLARIAKALYVEEWEIKSKSDPPPEARKPKPKPRPRSSAQRASSGHRPSRPRSGPSARPARPRRSPPKPQPARETQLAHLRQLAPLVGKTLEEIEKEVGKPLAEFTRRDASRVLFELQEILRQRKKEKGEEGTHNRKRAYLPEGVDRFELDYLTRVKEEQTPVRFHLFDGTEVVGVVVGFSPYAITVRTNDEEQTLNKLAIAWYTREVEAHHE